MLFALFFISFALSQPTFNWTKCPHPWEVQTPGKFDDFSLDRFKGTYYELWLHDWTQYPTCPKGPTCVRSLKSINMQRQLVNDTWSLECFGKAYDVPLYFNVTDTKGFLMGWTPETNVIGVTFPDTVVDFQPSADGKQYDWVVEFQCVDGKVLGKPKVEFTAFNFYSRYPKVDNKTEQAMLAAARSKGLGIYMDAGWGMYRVPQDDCLYETV